MTTLANLITYVSQDLRDSANNTWSSSEVTDLINAGIDTLSDLKPFEKIDTTTISAGVKTYALPSSLSLVYRVDVYTTSGSYSWTIPPAQGDGPNAGWEVHASILHLPPSVNWTAGETLRLYGYGRYVQLAASSSTTDLDTALIWALRAWCKVEAFQQLIADRVRYEQWQVSSANIDVTPIALGQLWLSSRRRWEQEQQRLRRMRKLG